MQHAHQRVLVGENTITLELLEELLEFVCNSTDEYALCGADTAYQCLAHTPTRSTPALPWHCLNYGSNSETPLK